MQPDERYDNRCSSMQQIYVSFACCRRLLKSKKSANKVGTV